MSLSEGHIKLFRDHNLCEELLPGLFKINVPLPNNPLKYINSYVVVGPTRFLIIDTGLNRSECLDQFLKAINFLNLDLNRTDFFITHMHSDHIGLLGNLVRSTSKVYFNEPELPNLDPDVKKERQKIRREFFVSNGFPEREYQLAIEKNPGALYGLKSKIDFTPVKDGYRIEMGNYCFECIGTPGHSPGHICLYEPGKKVLLSGDHVLNDITPNITWWPEMENSLRLYLKSLTKIEVLDVELLLPGHRAISNDLHKRVKEIQNHHKNRLNEVIMALGESDMTAFQIASKLSWDIKCKSWDHFPLSQKYFAVGEALAHIKHLEFSGRIESINIDNRYVYSLK